MLELDRSAADVVVISMPLAPVTAPSLQLGALTAAIRQRGIACRGLHFNVEFYSYVVAHAENSGLGRASLAEFEQLSHESLGNRWVFLGEPLIADGSSRAARLHAAVFGSGDPAPYPGFTDDQLRELRAMAPAFLGQCLAVVLAIHPRVVAFSCTFNQLQASLALSKRLKEECPHISVVFGGTRFNAEMGPAALRAYPWIDAVVRGDGENAVVPVFEPLVSGASPGALAGLCVRGRDGSIRIHDDVGATRADLSSVSVPDFDDYFARVERHPRQDIGEVWVETSRGCWWGETKAKCGFCGHRHQDLSYRKKTVEQIREEITLLAAKHRITHFSFADSCVDARLLGQALPALRERGYTFRFSCQGRVLNSRREFEVLARAGVQYYYAGIEHMSTSVLRLMGKGVSFLQAVRFLRWAAELGVKVTWNIICGYPGEDPSEYDRMAALVPRLVHLSPPFPLMPLVLSRSSKLWGDPEANGIRLLPPDPDCDCLVCDDDAVLTDLLPARSYKLIDHPHPATYVGKLRQAVNGWIANASADRTLCLERGPGFVRIEDRRDPRQPRRILLEGQLAAVYLACGNGATLRDLMACIEAGGEFEPDGDVLAKMLARFEAAGLIYSEGGRFLSLALDPAASSSEHAS